MVDVQRIALLSGVADAYPSVAPFGPSESYPEFPGLVPTPGAANRVYASVRESFRLLGLDADRYGTPAWDPLGEIIHPGDRVAIKPNFVLHFNSSGADVRAVVTHGSVLRPVLDYVLLALRGRGEVTVGDAPHGNADFEQIMQITGAREVVAACQNRGVPVRLVDFRKYRYGYGEEGFLKETRTPLAGDPEGYSTVDLGSDSALESLPRMERLYGADYDRSIIRDHHHPSRHEYLIANSILRADVVISLPKLKVHSKAGVTINLKNLVGINGDKNWLPHYRIGHPGNGGDEYPRSRSSVENGLRSIDRSLIDALLPKDSLVLKKLYKLYLRLYYPIIGRLTRLTGNPIHRGNWNGNDTIWRTVIDLNRILLYATKEGRMSSERQRRFLSIVDGIVAGEGQGPLGPTPRPCGVLLAGFDPLSVDWAGACLMGLDPERVPLLHHASRLSRLSFSDHPPQRSTIVSNDPAFEAMLSTGKPHLSFALPVGWRDRQDQPTTDQATEADESHLPPT
jgi:uncharacterized protein (DUF362 family)